MTDSSTSQAELEAEVRRLEARIEALQEEVQHERVARETSEALLDRAADGAFTAHVDAEGSVKEVWVDGSMPVQQDVLASVLDAEPVPAHCRHVVHTGQPVRFLVEPEANGAGSSRDLPSSIDLASPPAGEAPRLDAETEAWDVTLVPVQPDEAKLFEPPTDVHPDGQPGEREYVRGIIRTATAQAGRRVLRESHALQHELVELLPDAILIVGSDDRVLFSNSAAVDLVGASDEDEIRGTEIWEYVHPGSQARTRKWKDRIRRGAPIDFAEHKLIRSDGTSIPVETASVPVIYQGQRAALIAVRDLAGRRRMAETIQHTLDLFDKAFHLGPSALLITRLRDGMILEVSDRMVEFAGRKARDLLGETIAQLDISMSSASLEALSKELMDQGAIHDRELRVHMPGEGPRVVLLSARLTEIDHAVCALVSLVDITERKKAAVAVRESRTLLDKIFRASPAPIAICRLDDWQYMDVNDAMCSLVGFPHDEIVGHRPDDLNLWVNESQEERLADRLAAQDAVYDVEARFRRSDGSIVTALSSFQRISVEGEECVLAVMTDITQREEKKQALIEAKERAEEIAQFRSTVLSNMTHEVRTPLTVILGFTSILSDGVRDDYQRFVDLIERSGRRLLLTLDSLLDLAQLEAGTLDPDMEIQSVADAVTRMTSSHAEAVEENDLVFSVDVPETHVFAEFDFELLGRVVNHLIDNALKFTEDGSISVEVKQRRDDVAICVRDTGAGIDKAFQARIFDAFAQESEGNTRSHQGSGLGLTVSKRIVECMGGQLTIDSEKGTGTCVSVTFPVVNVDA